MGVSYGKKFTSLSGGNNVNADQRPMEGIDYPRIIRRYETIWRNKKVHWSGIAKSLDGKFTFHGT